MRTRPEVSVVIPVYNGERYLREAVASVRAQTVAVHEIILVDDGSTDGTPSVIDGLGDGLRVARQDNAGPAAALNRGVAMACGTHVTFLSADDRWRPDKLERQLAVLDAQPAVDLVFGHVLHFVSPDLDETTARTLRVPPDPMPAFSAGTLLTRLDTFQRVGPFDERHRVGEFFDWKARADDLGLRALMLDDVVSDRRVHASNHSRESRAPQEGYAKVLKAMVDRRRAEAARPGSDGAAS